jgi:hypothetical protein
METSCSASLGGLAHRWRVRGLARMCMKRPRPDSMSLSLSAGIKGSITPAFWLQLYGLLMFNSMLSFGHAAYRVIQCRTVLYCTSLNNVPKWLAGFLFNVLSPKVPVHCRQASPFNRSPNVQCLGFGAACGARFPWDGNDLSINVRPSG